MEAWKVVLGGAAIVGGVWWFAKRRSVTVETPALTKPLVKEAAKVMEKATEKIKAAVDEDVKAPPGAPAVVGKVIALIKLKRANQYHVEVAVQAIRALNLDKTLPDFVVQFGQYLKKHQPDVYDKWVAARTNTEAWRKLYWYNPVAAAASELSLRIIPGA